MLVHLFKATQYRQRIARYGREAVYNPKPVSFSIWFLIYLRKCEKKGAEFTFLCPGLSGSNGLNKSQC
jgi:hypothetical protein